MSHPVRAPLSRFLAAPLVAVSLILLACSSPKPPESTGQQAPVTAPAIVPEPTPSEPPATIDPAPPPEVPAAAEPASDAPATQTLFVREQRADCQGEAPMKCLQVRDTQSGPWRNLYASIEGFDYEESYAYELRVEVTRVPAPAADAPSLRYKLLQVVDKRKVAPSPATP